MDDQTVQIMVVDTETTGIDEEAKLLEIGAIGMSAPSYFHTEAMGHEVIETDSFIHASSLAFCEADIPPEVSAIHHITKDMVQESPDPAAAVLDVKRISVDAPEPDYIVAHNADFDMRFLKDYFPPDQKIICTYKVALVLYPDAPNHKNATLFYYLGLRSRSETPDDEWFEKMSLHRALPDALLTAFVFREMAGLLDLESMVKISSRPGLLPRCTFGKHHGKKWEDIPKSYLDWVLGNIKDKPDVTYTVERELIRRARS